MKVNVNFTIEFDQAEYNAAFATEDEPLSVERIRDEVKGAARTNLMYPILDEGVEVRVVKVA